MKNRALLAVASLLAVLVVFAVHSLDFPGSVPDFVRASGVGVLFDVKPSFSEDVIYRRLTDFGERGRTNYAFRNRTVDVLLPLAIFPALLLLMVHTAGRFSLGRGLRAALYSLPFVFVIFDFAENALVLGLLASFPDRAPLLAGALPYLTMVKRIASLLSLTIPLVMFIVALALAKKAKG